MHVSFRNFRPLKKKKSHAVQVYGTEPVSPSFLINALASIHVSSGGDMNTLPSSFSALFLFAHMREEGRREKEAG